MLNAQHSVLDFRRTGRKPSTYTIWRSHLTSGVPSNSNVARVTWKDFIIVKCTDMYTDVQHHKAGDVVFSLVFVRKRNASRATSVTSPYLCFGYVSCPVCTWGPMREIWSLYSRTCQPRTLFLVKLVKNMDTSVKVLSCNRKNDRKKIIFPSYIFHYVCIFLNCMLMVKFYSTFEKITNSYNHCSFASASTADQAWAYAMSLYNCFRPWQL